MKLIIIIFVFTSMLVAQDTTPPEVVEAFYGHTIELSYSVWMDDDVLEIPNYEMFDSSLRLREIYHITRVDTHKVHLKVPILPYKVNYVIRVSNVHDIKGISIADENSAWITFEGFSLTEQQPYLIVK